MSEQSFHSSSASGVSRGKDGHLQKVSTHREHHKPQGEISKHTTALLSAGPEIPLAEKVSVIVSANEGNITKLVKISRSCRLGTH